MTRIVIDDRQPLATAAGQTIAYQQASGRAVGELGAGDSNNASIQYIQLGKDADGQVRYTASFVVIKSVDVARASGLLWHDVPNRGSPITIRHTHHHQCGRTQPGRHRTGQCLAG